MLKVVSWCFMKVVPVFIFVTPTDLTKTSECGRPPIE